MADREARLHAVGGDAEEGVDGMARGHDDVGRQHHLGGPAGPDVQVMDAIDAGECFELAADRPRGRSSSARRRTSGAANRRTDARCRGTMTMAIARLVTGSTHSQPCQSTSAPAITTPAETTASDAMCRKAPRMLMSSWRPRMKSSAVPRLTTMPIAATTITVIGCVASGRVQPADRGPRQRAHRHQQQQGVGEGGEDRGAFPAPGVSLVGLQPPGESTGPGEDEAEHVAEVVAGIGQQRQRIDAPAVERLDRHEGGVDGDADREGTVVARRARASGPACEWPWPPWASDATRAWVSAWPCAAWSWPACAA